MMKSLGKEVSALGIARIYKGLVDIMVLDTVDAHLAPSINELGIHTVVTNTIMTRATDKKSLARAAVWALEKYGGR